MMSIVSRVTTLPPKSQSKALEAASFSACFLLLQGRPMICTPLNSQTAINWLFDKLVL
ncbi:hypothetical protein HanIR_Chr17g0872781 [Helianthus annuus]|nr:hypothetical protein HanIR_Chr17g0872781 [Helianthus annuus]